MKKIFFLLTVLMLLSCKSDKSKSSVEQNTEEAAVFTKKTELLDKIALKVEMNFETDTEGLFQIKIKNPDEPKKRIIEYFSIKEVSIPQTIDLEYDLENNSFPEYVQFIFGAKKEQKIKLNSLRLFTDDIMIKIDKGNFNDFIKTSKYVDFDELSGILTTKMVAGKYLPIIMLNKKALDSLEN